MPRVHIMIVIRKTKSGRNIYLPGGGDAMSGALKRRRKKRAKKAAPKRKR